MRARGVDDPPPPARLHPRHGCPRGVESGGEIERDDRVPLVGREGFDRGDVLHPGIIDENIDRADRLHHPRDGGRVHQVGTIIGRAQFLAQR